MMITMQSTLNKLLDENSPAATRVNHSRKEGVKKLIKKKKIRSRCGEKKKIQT